MGFVFPCAGCLSAAHDNHDVKRKRVITSGLSRGPVAVGTEGVAVDPGSRPG